MAQIRNVHLAGFTPGKKAFVSAVVANNNNSVSCTMTLVKEGEVWKVEGFTVP
jgi:hypothetical protein